MKQKIEANKHLATAFGSEEAMMYAYIRQEKTVPPWWLDSIGSTYDGATPGVNAQEFQVGHI